MRRRTLRTRSRVSAEYHFGACVGVVVVRGEEAVVRMRLGWEGDGFGGIFLVYIGMIVRRWLVGGSGTL